MLTFSRNHQTLESLCGIIHESARVHWFWWSKESESWAMLKRFFISIDCQWTWNALLFLHVFTFSIMLEKTPCSCIWRQSKRSAKHEHLNCWIFYFPLNFRSTFCRLPYIFISYVICFFCNQLQPRALAKPVPRLKRTDGKRKERKNAFLSVCNLKIELKFLWCVEKRFQLLVRYFHFLSSPLRCKNQIKAQQCLRNSHLRDEKFTHELIIIFDDIAAQDVCQHVNGKFTSFKPEHHIVRCDMNSTFIARVNSRYGPHRRGRELLNMKIIHFNHSIRKKTICFLMKWKKSFSTKKTEPKLELNEW